MAAPAAEEGASDSEDHVQCPVVLCFEYDASVVVGEETVESVGIVQDDHVDVEVGSRSLFLNDGEYGTGVFEGRSASGKKKAFGVRGSGTGKKIF